jgi:integrase
MADAGQYAPAPGVGLSPGRSPRGRSRRHAVPAPSGAGGGLAIFACGQLVSFPLPLTLVEADPENTWLYRVWHGTPEDWQELLVKLSERGVRLWSPQCATMVCNLALSSTSTQPLRAALEHARREKLLTRNVRQAGPMKQPIKDGDNPPYPMEQAKSFLQVAGPSTCCEVDMHAAARAASQRGMRLRWSDVNLDERTIRVARGVHRVTRLLDLSTNKNQAIETVPLPGLCVRALRNTRMPNSIT